MFILICDYLNGAVFLSDFCKLCVFSDEFGRGVSEVESYCGNEYISNVFNFQVTFATILTHLSQIEEEKDSVSEFCID